MEKETLSTYGWVIITIIVLFAMAEIVPQFANKISSGADLALVSDAKIETQIVSEQKYTPEQIMNDPNICGIGSEDNNSIVAILDGTTVTIELNNKNGYGAIKDWNAELDASDDTNIIRANRNIITKVIISKGITQIGNYAFYQCSKINSIQFPSTLKTIGYCSFSGCSGLNTIKLSRGLETIGSNAFADSAKYIYIPNDIMSIENNAFSGAASIKCEFGCNTSDWKPMWNQTNGIRIPTQFNCDFDY